MMDPYQRTGTWENSGINDANLRAMISNPLDLQRGAGASSSEGQEAVAAVTRFRTGSVKELPSSTLSEVGGSSGSGGAVGSPGAQ
jgi:type IV pilus biogenesis protein CpaD/CtpE